MQRKGAAGGLHPWASCLGAPALTAGLGAGARLLQPFACPLVGSGSFSYSCSAGRLRESRGYGLFSETAVLSSMGSKELIVEIAEMSLFYKPVLK